MAADEMPPRAACSAYCRPDRHLHTHLEYMDAPAEMCGVLIGRWRPAVDAPGAPLCFPPGEVRFMAVEPAPEAPPSPHPQYPFAVLVTVEVYA